MKSNVLARLDQEGGHWIANAFDREGVIAIGVGETELCAVSSLERALEEFFSVEVSPWLEKLQYAGDEATPNCPEGRVKLPIDLWYCKLFDRACPLQAQVFVDDPGVFFQGCLADEERKANIYRTASEGQYGGFHHVVGRGPCPHCEIRRGSEKSRSYFYPWELSCFRDFAGLVGDRDVESMLIKAIRLKAERSSVLGLLCACHALEAAELLDPQLAKRLRILEREVFRPPTRPKESRLGA